MGSHWGLVFLLTLWRVGSAVADDGEDFSNNLFSDLAPVLTLFGERVCMQFMSQAVGLADCILLAMVPLGIITTIVSAIRVGGPTWSKAVIGRARENLSAAEIELMSSTSRETCELWNGRNVIRCQGSARIWQFICLVSDNPHTEPQEDHPNTIEYKTLNDALDSKLIAETDVTGLKHAYIRYGKLRSSLWSNISHFMNRVRILRPLLRHPHKHGEKNHDPEAGNQNPKTSASTIQSKKCRKITIIQDSDPNAPNLSLNCHNRVNRAEIYLMAVVGILIQAGVLVFSGFITYYRPIQHRFQKDDNAVQKYAFPCFAAGTGTLVLGMFLCAFIIERSTEEKFYAPAEGAQFWIIWLQKHHVVNDQVFRPYAVYPTSNRTFITTSRRSSGLDSEKRNDNKQRSDNNDSAAETHEPKWGFFEWFHSKWLCLIRSHSWLEWLTLIGAFISLVGFVVQFIGLRGLNWTASVAQLIAIAIMTAARTWVRRGLAKPPESTPVTSHFELDWFALTLNDCKTAPWMKREGEEPDENQDKTSPSDPAKENVYEWTIFSGQEREYKPLGNDPNEPEHQESSAQEAITIRKELGNLANWQGPASEEAVRLSEVIEAVADTFLPWKKDSNPKTYTWILPVRYNMATSPTIGSQPTTESQSTEEPNDQISIILKHDGKGWRIPTADIEAALSLWMYSARSQEDVQDQRQESKSSESPSHRDKNTRLRFRGERKLSLRLFGPSRYKKHLVQDLEWWMPDIVPEVSTLEDIPEDLKSTLRERRVGFTKQKALGGELHDQRKTSLFYNIKNDKDENNHDYGWVYDYGWMYEGGSEDEGKSEDEGGSEDEGKSEDEGESKDEYEHITENSNLDGSFESFHEDTGSKGTVAVESYDALERLFSRDLLFSFIVATVKAPEFSTRIASVVGAIDYTDAMKSWKPPKLQNNDLTRLAQTMEKEGFGTLSEAYLDLIVPFSIENKLPRLDSLIEMAQKQAYEYEKAHEWYGLTDVALWLAGLAMRLDPHKDCACPRLIAVCLDFLRRMDSARKLQKEEGRYGDGLVLSRKILMKKLATARWPNISLFHHLIRGGDPLWKTGILKKVLHGPIIDSRAIVPESFQINGTYRAEALSYDWSDSDSMKVRQPDSFGWCPIHYGTLREYYRMMHYNEPRPGHWEHIFLQTAGSSLSDNCFQRDFRGWTPLHYTCLMGDKHNTVHLLEHNVIDANAVGNDGVTPMHCAAKGGNIDAVDSLLQNGYVCESQGGKRYRDYNERAPIHLAAVEGDIDVVKALISDIGLQDRFGWTPLHLAALYGHGEVVEYFMTFPSTNKDLQDYNLNTPLHLALQHKRDKVVKVLLEAGVDVNNKSADGKTPLHDASTVKSVQRLLRKGANKNAADNSGRTPLHLAASGENEETFRYLIEAGADINLPDDQGRTPLYEAVSSGRETKVLLLLEKGANINHTDNNGVTPLHVAIEHRAEETIIQLLLDHGADTTTYSGTWGSPLSTSVARGYLSAVKVLVEHDKKLEEKKRAVLFRDLHGNTALHAIGLIDVNSCPVWEDIIKELIDAGADVNAKNNQGQTPLGIAHMWNEEKIVYALREIGGEERR